MTDFDKVRAILDAASDGWMVRAYGMDAEVVRPDGSHMIIGDAIYHPQHVTDARAIVVSRNLAPELLAVAERFAAVLDEYDGLGLVHYPDFDALAERIIAGRTALDALDAKMRETLP